MKNRIRIWTNNEKSRSAMLLSRELNIRLRDADDDRKIPRLRHEGSTYTPRASDVVLNWGSSNENFPREFLKARVINHPNSLDLVTNKKKFFRHFKENGLENIIPEFSEGPSPEFESWGEQGRAGKDPDYPFAMIRHKLTGSAGEGIEMVTRNNVRKMGDNLRGKLLVRYIPKKSEWRVHYCRASSSIFYVQKKVLKNDRPAGFEPNWFVRNHDNGFVFAHGEDYVADTPQCVLEVAAAAAESTGLDFGAVDVVYNSYQQQAYVIEINSSPGLQGESLTKYCDMFWNEHIKRGE